MNKKYSDFICSVLKDEINFIFNDRYMKITLFILPALLVIFISAIFSSGVPKQIPVALVDNDHSSLSRKIISNIAASKNIELVAVPETLVQAQQLMKSMKVYAFVEIPRGASGSAFRQDSQRVVIRYNGQFRATGNVALNGLQSAVSDAHRILNERRLVGSELKGTMPLPLNIQVINISNSQNSYERFLAPIAIPVLLSIVLSAAVICAIGRFYETNVLYVIWTRKTRINLVAQTALRILPYVTVFFLWNLIYYIWQTAICGWPILGNAWVLILAISMLCFLTACIAVMLISITRSVIKALSLSTVYTSAALTYSDGTLSILNANGWAKFWSNFQPFTHYYRIQLEQVNLGSDIATSMHHFVILILYIIIPSAVSIFFLGKLKNTKPSAMDQVDFEFNGFKQSFITTLMSIKKCQPIFSTAVLSLILYSFFYPSAYKAQVNIKLPVIVVDLDRSSLSRNLISNLHATREVDVIQVDTSLLTALDLLRNRKVSAVITIDENFKNDLIRNGEADVDIHLSGGYMAIAADLRKVISNAIHSIADANRLPGKSNDIVVSLPLYNSTLGYETFIMPLVFIIVLQQTLMLSSSMLIALRIDMGINKINSSQFFGTFLGLLTIGFLGGVFIFGCVYHLKSYPSEGNAFLQIYLMIVFSCATILLGMLIGSFMDNINRPLQLLSATSMVIFYSSGASFPAFNMPLWVVRLMDIFPSSTMVSGFSMMNSQGANLPELMPVIIKITLLAGALLLLAMYRLVWRHIPIE